MLPMANICFLNFIYFWLLWVFAAAHRLFLVVASQGYSLVVVCRLLTVVAFLDGALWTQSAGLVVVVLG